MTEVQATFAETESEFFAAKKPGLCLWRFAEGFVTRLMFVCPCGCEAICGVTIKPTIPEGWEWNQDFEKPTLTPSIAINRGHWHGYLTAGVFKSC